MQDVHHVDFVYKALNKNNDEIRIVALQPSLDPTAAIECKILVAKLRDHPEYEALSYMWGSSSCPRAINIRGEEYKVTYNLWLALKRLRYAEEDRVLWVDAICINQEDTRKRNHEVGLMSSIYEQAKRVAVWLGPETEESRQAIAF